MIIRFGGVSRYSSKATRGRVRSAKALRAKFTETRSVFSRQPSQCDVSSHRFYDAIAAMLQALLDPAAYFEAVTMAMPHGPSPTLMRRNSFRDFTSTTETSLDAPFAV